MSAKDGADAQSDVVAAVQQGYAFDGPALELGALVVDGNGPPRRTGAHPARDGQPARPGRRRHRHRQDQDAAADGRAALRGRRPGVRRRHQGRPVRAGRAGRGQRPDDVAGPTEVGQAWSGLACPVELLALGGQGDGLDAARDDDVVRPDPAGEGARPQRGAGVLARPGVPLRRQGGAADARPQGPARGRAVPHQRRGQGRAQGARRAVAGDGGGDPARADRRSRTRAPTSSSASRSSTPPT